ncbi:MAG: hypothetical protein JW937_04980 [Candidatus Omnitrophica bacterium]|nr:hypothetical protein [Candidatus Omnitrophota bacterium]
MQHAVRAVVIFSLLFLAVSTPVQAGSTTVPQATISEIMKKLEEISGDVSRIRKFGIKGAGDSGDSTGRLEALSNQMAQVLKNQEQILQELGVIRIRASQK